MTCAAVKRLPCSGEEEGEAWGEVISIEFAAVIGVLGGASKPLKDREQNTKTSQVAFGIHEVGGSNSRKMGTP